MKYNIWNKWDPLEVCMIGNNYAPEFFNGLGTKAEDPLKRICEETLEDLEGYKETLQQFGVEVIQPQLDRNERFIDNPHEYPRGPLQPRDAQLVLGNKCYITGVDHPAIEQALRNYGPVEKINYSVTYPANMTQDQYEFIAGPDYPTYEEFVENRKNKDYFLDFVWKELTEHFRFFADRFSSATTFPIGTKLIIGHEPENKPTPINKLYEMIPVCQNFECTQVPLEGHSDGNFHPIKPGAILSLFEVQKYEENFPGWDVCYLGETSISAMKDFVKLKEKNQGKWYLAGEEDNDEFTHFVETWLQDWVGFVEETVFDVNVLMIDEHHCCVSQSNNEQVNTFLKKHKIEPIYVPWRHRFFWDGGLHCASLELVRRGTQKEYFND